MSPIDYQYQKPVRFMNIFIQYNNAPHSSFILCCSGLTKGINKKIYGTLTIVLGVEILCAPVNFSFFFLHPFWFFDLYIWFNINLNCSFWLYWNWTGYKLDILISDLQSFPDNKTVLYFCASKTPIGLFRGCPLVLMWNKMYNNLL